MGQPVADAFGVARRPVDRMLCDRVQPSDVRSCHDASTRRSRSAEASSSTTATPNGPTTSAGTGRPSCGTTPRTTTLSDGRPASARATAEFARTDPAHGVDHDRPAGSCRAIRRAAPATSAERTRRSPRHGSWPRPGAAGTSRERERGLERQEGEDETPPRPGRRRAACRPASEPERRAGRGGAIGCIDVTVRLRAPTPITIPTHRPAAVGPPPDQTPPDRTRRGAATHRRARPLRLTASRTRTPVPLPAPCPRSTSSTSIRGTHPGLEAELGATTARRRTAPGARTWFGALAAAMVLLVLLVGPLSAASTKTRLSGATVSPRSGTPATTIVVTVVYQNANGSRAERHQRVVRRRRPRR